MKTIAFLQAMFVSAVVSAQQTPTTGYAPVNGLKMYYEVHGSGEPVVLLHGAFMTIPNNWTGWIGELSKTRKVIAVEMQGHGRTADIKRDISALKTSPTMWLRCSIISKSQARTSSVTAWAAASRCSVRSAIRKKCARLSAFRPCSARTAGSRKHSTRSRNSRRKHSKARPIETEYKKLSPTPDEFPNFVKHVVAMAVETVRLRRRQAQGHQSADVFHPRRCRRRSARAHLGNVPPEGWRDFRRHASTLSIEIGHLAQHDTRHADGAHARHRPDGERLFRCKTAKAIKKLYNL